MWVQKQEVLFKLFEETEKKEHISTIFKGLGPRITVTPASHEVYTKEN